MRNAKLLCGILVFGGLLECASAGPLNISSATFNMSGVLTVTPTTIDWNSDVLPNNPMMFTLSVGTGPFAQEDGQNGVANLNNTTEPVGMTFTAQPFITFDVVGGLPTLNINFIALGTEVGNPDCFAAPAVNQTCTPPNPGGSPFTFTNEQNGTSDAEFYFSGVTSDGLDSWQGVFTSQFLVPFQTVLSNFASTGSISNSFSATVNVEAVPEPASFVLIGCGLGALVAFRKKLRRG